jgi:hypothetical protein
MKQRKIRAAQLITPFGPGAIVDVGGESLVCKDISEWPEHKCLPLAENSLEKILGKTIRRPPLDDSGAVVPFARFPKWMFCPSCRRLYFIDHAVDKANQYDKPVCTGKECSKATLVPMRFIAVCENGHMQDIDWHWWAHKNAQPSQSGRCNNRSEAELYFETKSASGGDFNSMEIRCKCGSRNTFDQLIGIPYPSKCSAKQPWQGYVQESCNAKLNVLPRAATNVYYPEIRSALDIGSDAIASAIGNESAFIEWLKTDPAEVRSIKVVSGMEKNWKEKFPDLYGHIIREAARNFYLDEDLIKKNLFDFIDGASIDSPIANDLSDKSQHGILRGEWAYLSRAESFDGANFKTRVENIAKLTALGFSDIFEQVTMIDRLREVKALVGFRRIKPDAETTIVPSDLNKNSNWMLGIDTFGEGIFIKFSEDLIRKWESDILKSIEGKSTKLAEKCIRWGRQPSHIYSSPRFISLHTFAHGLIRRLSFDTGYPATSLKERIYVGGQEDSMAGLLIFTSEGDSEGSLGGLVRQGEPDKLINTIKNTLIDLSWCSSDPVCSELENQGLDGLNSSACHACCLISETSCAFNNTLLDRRLVVGSIDGKLKGLFS